MVIIGTHWQPWDHWLSLVRTKGIAAPLDPLRQMGHWSKLSGPCPPPFAATTTTEKTETLKIQPKEKHGETEKTEKTETYTTICWSFGCHARGRGWKDNRNLKSWFSKFRFFRFFRFRQGFCSVVFPTFRFFRLCSILAKGKAVYPQINEVIGQGEGALPPWTQY